MKVKELIKRLSDMDQDSDVCQLWDGELRTIVDHVYMGQTGLCVTAGRHMVAYSDEGRPNNAPNSRDQQYWETPESG